MAESFCSLESRSKEERFEEMLLVGRRDGWTNKRRWRGVLLCTGPVCRDLRGFNFLNLTPRAIHHPATLQ